MGGYAWVTLATNDSYSLGALVLANSLRRVGTVHQLAVLITPGVTSSMREKLASVFNVVKEVNILDSKDQNNLRLLQRPELGITFTKLNCWRLTQFDKCVFLDADTLLLQNADELFERDEFSAAPDVGWPDCFNSGVYVYRPSEATYENLVKFALQTGSFDGADQGLLNLYFNEWAHKDISKHLPFIYNVCSTATYSYMPAFKQFSRNIKILHFIGNAKPWLQHFDFETRQVQITPGLEHLHGIIQQWWEIFCSSVHPVLSQQMASNSAFAENYTSLFFQPPHSLDYPRISGTIRREPNNCGCPPTTMPIESNINMRDPWDDYNDNDQTESLDIKSPFLPIHESELSFKPECIIIPAVYTEPVSNLLPIDDDVLCRDVFESPTNLVNQCNIEGDNKNLTLATTSHDFVSEQVENKCPVHFEESLNPSSPNHSNNSNAIAECNQLAWADTFEPICSITDEIALQVDPIESSDNNAGLAGAFAQLTLGCASTAEQRIIEDNLRRQNWESGNIDYMGRDAFENIWSKICETLSTPSETVTQEKEQTPPTAATSENLSEREISSKLSVDIPSPESVSKEEKPQECITAPIVDASSETKVESNIEVLPPVDKSVSLEDSSKIPETKTPTDVVPPSAPTQESVSAAPLVPVTTQLAAETESVPLTPSVSETIVDLPSVPLEKPNVQEVVKVCETQPLEVKDEKCEPSMVASKALIEESKKEPSSPTELSQKPLSTEIIPSQDSDGICSAIKSSEVIVPSDVVKSSEIPTPNTEKVKIPESISQLLIAPIECVKTDEKSSEVVFETPQPVPIMEPSPQTQEVKIQPVLPSECSLPESSLVETTKATTTAQQTKVSDTSKPKETPKSPLPSECPSKKSQKVEPAKVVTKESQSSEPQKTSKPSPPVERSLKKSPEGKSPQVKESEIPKQQETPKLPPSAECSLKKSPEVETAKSATSQEIKASGTTKPQETQKLPQVEATKIIKPPSTAQQQPKETGAPKAESQKVLPKTETEKEPAKPSSKAQSSEAGAVSGSQQGPAPPPRKSGGTKKASGKSKK